MQALRYLQHGSHDAFRLREVIATTRQLIPGSSRRQLDAAQMAEHQLGVLFRHLFARKVHAAERWQPRSRVHTHPTSTAHCLQNSHVVEAILSATQHSAWFDAIFKLVKSEKPTGKTMVRATAVLLRQMLAVICGVSASECCAVQNALPLYDWNAFCQLLASRTTDFLRTRLPKNATTNKNANTANQRTALPNPLSALANKSHTSAFAGASLAEFLSQHLSADEASEARAMLTGQRWRLWPRVGLGPINPQHFCREMVRMHPLFESQLMAVDTLLCQCMTPPPNPDSSVALSALHVPLVEATGDWTRWFHELRHTQRVVPPDAEEQDREVSPRKFPNPSHIVVFQDCRVAALEAVNCSECYFGVGVYDDQNRDLNSATTVEWRSDQAAMRGSVRTLPAWLADPDSPGLMQQLRRQPLILTQQRGIAELWFVICNDDNYMVLLARHTGQPHICINMHTRIAIVNNSRRTTTLRSHSSLSTAVPASFRL